MTSITRDDLRGANRLVVQAVIGATDIAEALHAHILGLPRRLAGMTRKASTGGIPGLAYASVRRIARFGGASVALALRGLPGMQGSDTPAPSREAVIAALNGVLGDHLAANDNPLAINASLRKRGQTLDLRRDSLLRAFPDSRPCLLVLVHGLCMNDLQWRQDGHDHGMRLAEDLGFEPIHFHYNSGLPIDDNGARLSLLLQQLVDAWPVPVDRIAIVGHSMGGLVARAAIATAHAHDSGWMRALDALVTLGTPHLGAPLERTGVLLQGLLGSNGFSAPFTALGGLRSAGIRDLRHGALPGGVAPLPGALRIYMVAGSLQARATDRRRRHPRGDGLVPVASAFGEHRDPSLSLSVPQARKRVVYGTGHIALLADDRVHAQLHTWLADSPREARRAATPAA